MINTHLLRDGHSKEELRQSPWTGLQSPVTDPCPPVSFVTSVPKKSQVSNLALARFSQPLNVYQLKPELHRHKDYKGLF